MEIELLNEYINEEMYWSALSIGEYLFNKNGNTENFYIITQSLYGLCFYERCISLCNKYPEYLKYYEIQNLFLKCFHKSSSDEKIDESILHEKTVNINVTSIRLEIEQKSVRKFLEANINFDSIRKKLLIDAVMTDNRNFEALFILKNENLCSKNEMLKVLEKLENLELKKLYGEILYPKDICFNFYESNFISPHISEKLAKELYKKNCLPELFNLGVFMVKNFPKYDRSYIILGIYFFAKNNYNEAKKCFYESVKINKSGGKGWLYLGLAYSLGNESENALSCFRTAEKYMVGSYKPNMYIGYEYHIMNHPKQACIYYRKALKIKNSLNIYKKYVSMLIYYEGYKEAHKILNSDVIDFKNADSITISTFALLNCYCNLFLGNIKEADLHLQNCQNDWKYYATRGFIYHMRVKALDAINNYQEALIRKGECKILRDLLELSIQNLNENINTIVFEFAADLFDFLDLKSLDLLSL
ncbi:hypothetical protein CWI37_0655p0020 [Hamiltosporidium tvaerminnensis]|uniref:Uncharacterized protein n=2 Tax=Hamiltosporidium TaxID=1176354 RepID=A0A4V2JW51_9MICR|nr:hypothetical protein CWI37_0655p0020 [Hamiltosporidium tvaerminnensis]TBU06392.1 hypothetical protein CWI39_0503p0020 [Hamiltosporidium magnivora]